MERNWSEAAREVLEAYPWRHDADKVKARAEAELVAFGEAVEIGDLPLALRRWAARRSKPIPAGENIWRGETWAEAVREFERAVIGQAQAANGLSPVAAARALGTTARIVTYKARKHGIEFNTKKSKKQNKKG